MTKEDFIELQAPDKYDFSNDGANSEYRDIDNLENGLEKFFVYKAVTMKPYKLETEDKRDFFECGAKFCSDCKTNFGEIKDPDSNSELLKEIYKELWNEANLKRCWKGDSIKGDTMNSVNTTLNVLYEFIIEKAEDAAKRKAIGRRGQNVSIHYILDRYRREVEGHEELFNGIKIKGMSDFISVYHTLGNFIPVPVGCNRPRGTGLLKDYWDLTLACI